MATESKREREEEVVKVDCLTFSYRPAEPPALIDVSLSLSAGTYTPLSPVCRVLAVPSLYLCLYLCLCPCPCPCLCVFRCPVSDCGGQRRRYVHSHSESGTLWPPPVLSLSLCVCVFLLFLPCGYVCVLNGVHSALWCFCALKECR